MKKLIWLTVAFSGIAGATCQDIYDPMNGGWVYECTPQPSDPRPPICHQEYDPMNGVWVTVCN